MSFTDKRKRNKTHKRKRNWIRKEDHVPNPVRPLGWVGYGGMSRHTPCVRLAGKMLIMSFKECPIASDIWKSLLLTDQVQWFEGLTSMAWPGVLCLLSPYGGFGAGEMGMFTLMLITPWGIS